MWSFEGAPSASDSFQTIGFVKAVMGRWSMWKSAKGMEPLPHHVTKELAKGQAFPGIRIGFAPEILLRPVEAF
jgi:hypothetical protein